MFFDKRFGAALSVALSLTGAAASTAAPQIQFARETVEFGRIKTGEPITVNFEVSNAGDEQLDITGVKPGCGCTHAEAKKTALAAGESTTIEAVFNSTGFSGAISKSITVTSNDPSRPSLSLNIKGDVVPLAIVTPSMLNFGTLKKGGTAPYTIIVTPTDPTPLNVLKVEPSGTHVKVTGFRKRDSATGPSWHVFATVTGGETPGRVMESLRIVTDAKQNPMLTVTVYGNVAE